MTTLFDALGLLFLAFGLWGGVEVLHAGGGIGAAFWPVFAGAVAAGFFQSR